MKKNFFAFTTSRGPTRRIRSFVRELTRSIPFSFCINRGHKSLFNVAIDAKLSQAERLIICSAYKGNPGKLTFYSLTDDFNKYPIEFQILGVTLYREKLPNAKMETQVTNLRLSIDKNVDSILQEFLEEFLKPVIITEKSKNKDIKTNIGLVSVLKINERKLELKIELQETKKLNSPIIRFKLLLNPKNKDLLQ
ncbi:MAG: hypothetical protein ACFFC7_00730 [Candidatus Hermodarchaeota archaeon]